MLAVAKYFNVLDVSVSITAQTTGALCGLLYSLVALKGAASNSEYYGVPVRFRDQGRIAVLAYFSGVLALILFRGDLFLLSSLCSQLNQVGVYSVAVFAVEVALKIPQWAASILTASVAADSRLAVSRTLRLFWHSVGISFLLFVCFLVIKKPFESVLNDILGPSFDGVWIVMLAVFPRVVFQAGGSILAANLAGRGYTLWHPGATLGGMLAVLALDVALVPRLGALGAGLASSVGYLAALVLVFVGFLKTNNIDTRDFLNDSVAMLRRH
jgi:O-antigen/teichoic acid export membrane protein